MEFNINLTELYKSQFGIVAPTVATTTFIENEVTGNLRNLSVLEDDRNYQNFSEMGIPVWDIIELENFYEDGTGDYFSGYKFPAETTLEATRGKQIVETNVIGLDGMVEELISLDDWQFNLKGFIINYDSESYPSDKVKDLVRACSLRHTNISIVSEFMLNLGVGYISIHELSLPQLPGYSNVQPFQITMKSKKPFTVSLANGIVL
ncbi:hypothetical protein MAR621_03121 [Maribacter dokdonensis]|uniref:DUF6046 domain-containing protein n=1 Tax=Maribacter dokdonensis TaxID=320912 RepID=UPI001B259D92|nr:DUF6046 domain-containing protein [Maribacter dokdonensis]CAG2532927.1 hypothetical protein MAR621_03121 [Maribacter dokdonensis]